jgi:hypothetical protein
MLEFYNSQGWWFTYINHKIISRIQAMIKNHQIIIIRNDTCRHCFKKVVLNMQLKINKFLCTKNLEVIFSVQSNIF